VVDKGLTVTELTPVPPETIVPPQLTVNQSVVNPVPGLVTEMVDDEPRQIVAGLAVIPVGTEGPIQVVLETFKIPLVAAKKVSFLLVADDVVLPQVPLIAPAPARDKEFVGIVKPAPIFAVAPLIDKLAPTELPVSIDFAPLPESTRLL